MARKPMDVKITGVREVNAALNSVSSQLARRIGGNAARAGARVLRDEARRNVPFGHWEDDLRVRTAKSGEERKRTSRTAIVDFKDHSQAKRLGHIFEFGTVGRYQKTTGRYTGFITPWPFMRPALATAGAQSIRATSKRLGKELKKHTQRLQSLRYKL